MFDKDQRIYCLQKKRLTIDDLFLIFKNYESSLLRLWAIIRTFDTRDFAALLFVLENVSTRKLSRAYCYKNRKHMFKLTTGSREHKKQNILQTRLFVKKKWSKRKIRSEIANKLSDINDVPIMPLIIKRLRTNNREVIDATKYNTKNEIKILQSKEFKILMNNLATKQWKRLIYNITNLFLPESMQNERNQRTRFTNSLFNRFIIFYDSMERIDTVRYAAESNIKSYNTKEENNNTTSIFSSSRNFFLTDSMYLSLKLNKYLSDEQKNII